MSRHVQVSHLLMSSCYYLPRLLLDFTEINISDHTRDKHYFSMLAELNKYGF